MRKFLKIFLRSLGTYLGVGGGLTRPSFIVGFNRLVILITYGMRYITMEAVSLVCTFAQDRASSTMCYTHLTFPPWVREVSSGIEVLGEGIFFGLGGSQDKPNWGERPCMRLCGNV